ncbi:PRD domain-containing protein [Lentibacillus sp. L22]|uniref:BglG family transcription antiterminator n=1 Tax=Lentibacillus sp. L22 TaxID=3163028 RepID=UPI003466DC6D
MYITGRARKVIELLLNKEEGMTVKEIADQLDVAPRTIHRDLKSIEKVLFGHRLELVKKAGIGLRIIGDEDDKEQLVQTLSQMTATDFTPEERRTIILASLLGAKEPIKLITLAIDLHVTVATISNDLDQLEQMLKDFHLGIIRKRGYGVELKGSEANKRVSISNLISKHVDPFTFVNLVKENMQKQAKPELNTISHRLLGLVNPGTLSLIEQRVEKARKELPHELADSAYIGLVVHLALAMERLKKGDKIQFDKEFLKQMEGTKEYRIAKDMIEDLAISLSMDIPDDEIGYITMHLMGAKLREDQHFLLEDTNIDIVYNIEKLIQYVGNKLDVDLTGNIALRNDLAAHLKPTIYRLKQGMNITNPLLDEIKRDYLDLFQLIQEATNEVFPKMVFPDDEIGYLVLHFAAALMHEAKELSALVICSSGIGTAKILASNLAQQFREIKHVTNVSMFDLPSIDPDQYDLIVSTIPLEGFKHDYILTSPILRKSEVHRIRRRIREKNLVSNVSKKPTKSEEMKHTDFLLRLESMKLYASAILELLASFYVKQMTEKQSMNAVLEWICTNLATKQLIHDKDTLISTLLEREKKGGLGIPSTSMVLLHTRSNQVLRPSFTIHSLDQPISVQGMDGKQMEANTLLLMLARDDSPKETLDVFSYLSSLLIQGPANARLFQSGNEARIRAFLEKQMELFLKEKNLL